jgi:ribosomal protein S18 acetylase RimI-like enzyme
VEIREATENDAVAIALLWTAAYCGEEPGMRSHPYEVAEVEAARARGRVFVGDEDGVVAGVVVLYPMGAPGVAVAGPEETELSRLAVVERFQHRGIAWALTSHCIDTSLEMGAEGIALWSRPHQLAAQRLYAYLNFKRDHARDAVDDFGERMAFRIWFAE